MPTRHPSYRFYDNEKYGKSQAIAIPAEVVGRQDERFNQLLTIVDDAAIRLAVLEGEYQWHRHEDADEFFLVLDGQLFVDVRDRDTVSLRRHEAFTVPKGVMHRTKAQKKTVVLVVGRVGTSPIGD